MAPLNEMLTHALLDEVNSFWFRHMPDPDSIIAPDVADAGPWFSATEDFDKECIEKFGPVLDTIKTTKPSADEILATANPATALHWMSLIILLDQLPRNCYRGPGVGIAYSFFDPLALAISLQAIERGIPNDPAVRFRLAYKFWFCMPLEHSEELKIQEKLSNEHANMWGEIDNLIESPEGEANKELAQYCAAFNKRRESYERFKGTIQGICDSHMHQIRSFGRYPYRNERLGRVSTKEELEYLNQKP